MNRITLAVVFILVVVSCRREDRLSAREGFIHVKGGKVWFRVQGSGGGTPILMLHGGPGHPSFYLNPMADLGKERPVITFDQLGCGRSDRITDTTLMTIENYVAQTHELVNHLNLETFFLYGHSWGTMLGIEYYLKHGSNVKGLILASPCLSAQRWLQDADDLITTLPDSVKVILRNNMKGIPQDSTILIRAVGSYLNRFYARHQPISADLDSANAQMGSNVYQYMWGDHEFFATGILKDFDRTGRLSEITVPTLYTVGEFDESPPATVKYYQSLTPNSSLRIIADAGHMTMHDNPIDNLRVISEFLREVD